MTNKKLLLGIFFLFLLVGTMMQVSAFMPKNTHALIHSNALAEQYDSEWYDACVSYPELCYTGNILSDVSVIYYWTLGYRYGVTHAPVFCRALIESAGNDPSSPATPQEEYACAIGGCMHQPADIASHSIYNGKKGLVPTAIEKSFLVNNIVHVFAEQKVDLWVSDNYPLISSDSEKRLTNYEKCTPLFKRVMLGTEEYEGVEETDLDKLFDKFISEIQTSQTGYDPAYQSKSFLVNFQSLPVSIIAIYFIVLGYFMLVVSMVGLKIYKREAKLRHYITLIIFLPIMIILIYILIANATGGAFQAIINVASPISRLVPIGNPPKYYIDMGIDNTKQFLRYGPQWLTDTEASGFTALEEADQGVMWVDYFIIGTLLIGLILWTYYIFKKNKVISNDILSL